MARRERVVVVFPGRGSYNATELGYLARHHADRPELIGALDAVVAKRGGTPPSELDAAEKFSPSTHLPGRNASNLIYACAQADFAAIDREQFEIVAVCGNSLGWYLALAAAGAVSREGGATIVDSMGDRMQREAPGGQLIYPLTDEAWRIDPERAALVERAVDETPDAYRSIALGGMAVLAGTDEAIRTLGECLPQVDERFPMKLARHGAFHTPLMDGISAEALGALEPSLFEQAELPMIDGRGHVWTPGLYDTADLHAYTFGHQIVRPYDFSASIAVAVKEFAPDRLILTGPGGSLGPPVAQALIALEWWDLASRANFAAMQKREPRVIAMGRDDQRAFATG